MKKLLDETTDELTRSLLDAGRAHRPPVGNQTRLLLALGVGSSIGLLSSKAFAWLGSSAGKLTLVSVGVLGIAGAAYTFAPRPSAGDSSARASSATASSAQSSSETVEARAALTPQPPVADVALAAQRGSPDVALAAQPSSPEPAVLPRVARASRRAHAPAAERNERRLSSAERRSAARRDHALRAVASESAGESTEASQPSAPSESTLKSEVALVDAMRGAAARRDGEALRRLIANYRGSFPEGQLRQEVSELALHPLATAR